MAAETFHAQVYRLVERIPRGRVTTYGRIAALIGRPRSARQVGYALARAPAGAGLPCHRVVNRAGRTAPGFAFGDPLLQSALLRAEGVTFTDAGRVDLARHLWPAAGER